MTVKVGLATVLVSALIFALYNMSIQPSVTTDFRLLDTNGEVVTHQSFSNSLKMVFFGYSQCPGECPKSLQYIKRLFADKPNMVSQFRVLFVTLDPAVDKSEVLRKYLDGFHTSIVGLSGSESEIEKTARSFRYLFKSNAGKIKHEAHIFLISQDGHFIDVWDLSNLSFSEFSEKVSRAL
ncbi:MAG: SCO family protein [Bdellovibrionales bacterium]|nr:SCO family protein [Bdellovibrionales bacterium]